MFNLPRTTLLLGFLLLLTACGPDLREGVADAMTTLPEEIDFNFHVKPILSDRCYACHGPDAQNQQAGLRLDEPAGAYATLASGRTAIVPGDPAASELVHRINATDPEIVMPTPESHLTLSAREIAILTRWVEQGAAYKEHWAFTKPERPAVPTAGEGWARNEVDRFVAAKLEREGVAPSPEAERPYLIRRLFFDLTGLPPTVAELDRWEAATAPDWYEQLTDDLLARPAYGERMATYWMDVARFADSEGYLDDFHHELWPYRDWVIRAYNENLPHDRFIEWQVGGDQHENPTRDQLLATAFNRNHKQNSEGGIIPEEFRVEYVADRANTVGTAFMGLTMGCARCHDHKYDPISQRDYFELFAFFNNTVERGDAIFALNGINNANDIPHELAMNAGPTLALPDSATQAIYDHIREMIATEEAELERLVAPVGTLPAEQRTGVASTSAPEKLTEAAAARVVRERTVHHFDFEQETVRDLAGGAMNYNQLRTLPGKIGRAVEVTDGVLATNGDRSRFEQSDAFTVSFWIMAPKVYPEAHFLYNSNWRIQGYRGWDVMLDSNRVHFRLNHAHPFQSIDVRADEPLIPGEWTHFTWSYDGSGRAAGTRLYRNGNAILPTVVRDHLIRSTVPYQGEAQPATVYAGYQGLVIGQRHYDLNFAGGQLDELRVLNTEAGDHLARYLYDESLGNYTPPDAAAAREFDLLHRSPVLDEHRARLRQLRTRAVATIDTVREIMVMGDNEQTTRQAYVLDRGVYDAHGQPVSSDIPEALMAWPADLPRNRYGLGKWLTHPDNPLTARVAVNQLWYLMFGRGLVESVEDFGNQGALPTHPALLDYLAVDYRENGWDTKRLLRQLVTSATYRQSSRVREDLAERDPDNHWLARAPRYRRSAEMIRDNALAVSGLLQERVGGPSVFPYQPAGLWKEVNNHGFSPTYRIDEDNLYRRSLYTFWKRNAPVPSMLTFDASLRGECQVRRQRSNTPLQALVLLNDPLTTEACRALAARTLAADSNVPPSTRVFRALTGRPPTDAEQAIIDQYYEDELDYFHDHPLATQEYLRTGYDDTDQSAGPARLAALARVASTVLNSTEGFHKN